MLEQAAAASNAVDAAAAMAIAAEGTSTAMAANGAAGAAPAADAAATTPAVGTPAATDAASANHPTLVADGGAATPTDGAAGASATVDSLQERTRRRAGARARYEDEHAPSLRPAAAVNTPSASGGTALSLVAAGSGAAVATPAMIASAQDGTAAATDSAAAGTPAATPVAGAGVAMPAAAGSARQPTRRRSVPATRYDDEHPSFVRQKATGKRNISQAWQSGEGRIDREEEEEGGEEEEEEEEGVAAEEEAADGAAVARRAVLRTRCGSREMLASPSDLFVDGGIGEVQSLCYVIHSHFGGEDYASQLRVELMAPPAVVPLLEWCRAAPRRFTARQAWRGARHNGAPDLTFPLAAETLLALERNGFCRRARKALR